MHHADEHPRDARAEHWRARPCPVRSLVGRHARPGELRVALVVDLRIFDAEARALGEAMVVAKTPLLCTRRWDTDHAGHAACLGVERLDRAKTDRNGTG